jgi:MFS family permease
LSVLSVPRRGGVELHSQYRALVASNTLTALASGMQQLLQGWLAVTWGHSLLFLAVFAVLRIVPKLLLTVPAGIICDRVPRLRVLVATRVGNVFVSVLPLLGFVLPVPLAWVLVAVVLGGVLHAFDMPAGRAVLGDVTDEADLCSVISLNHGGSHLAALIGPPLAYLMGPPGLLVAATLFLIASVLTSLLRPASTGREQCSSAISADIGEFLTFMQRAPTAATLIVLGAAPGVVDKAVALALPSLSSGGVTGIALMAPEVGALMAAVALSIQPLRFSIGAILLTIVCYALLLGFALGFSYEPEFLIVGLFAAGIAKLTFNTGTQTRLQQTVPPGLRGRALSF